MTDLLDSGSENSPFFGFVAKEFRARGTDLRKKLATKTHGGAVAESLGLKNARVLATSGTPASLLTQSLPERFVLKYAHGWSARGVMLLQDSEIPDHMFEQLSQRLLHRERIADMQQQVSNSFPNKPDEWLVEEWLPSATPGPIPFDYKFYTFGRSVGLIVQIDRNTHPVKVALFDGTFTPLRPTIDYVLSDSAQYGHHLLPKHPLQMLRWAAVLSQQTDSPFVSIDLFDTPDEPAFGEFTFSPGGLHKRMWTLTGEVITMLDERFAGVPSRHDQRSWSPTTDLIDLSSAEIAKIDAHELAELEDIPQALYQNWSQYFYNRGRRGAVRLSEYYVNKADSLAGQEHTTLLRALAQRWQTLGATLSATRSPRLTP